MLTQFNLSPQTEDDRFRRLLVLSEDPAFFRRLGRLLAGNYYYRCESFEDEPMLRRMLLSDPYLIIIADGGMDEERARSLIRAAEGILQVADGRPAVVFVGGDARLGAFLPDNGYFTIVCDHENDDLTVCRRIDLMAAVQKIRYGGEDDFPEGEHRRTVKHPSGFGFSLFKRSKSR